MPDDMLVKMQFSSEAFELTAQWTITYHMIFESLAYGSPHVREHVQCERMIFLVLQTSYGEHTKDAISSRLISRPKSLCVHSVRNNLHWKWIVRVRQLLKTLRIGDDRQSVPENRSS